MEEDAAFVACCACVLRTASLWWSSHTSRTRRSVPCARGSTTDVLTRQHFLWHSVRRVWVAVRGGAWRHVAARGGARHGICCYDMARSAATVALPWPCSYHHASHHALPQDSPLTTTATLPAHTTLSPFTTRPRPFKCLASCKGLGALRELRVEGELRIGMVLPLSSLKGFGRE